MDSGPGGEMNIRLHNNRQQRQERRVYCRMRLGINRLRIVDAMLLAKFRALLIHSQTRCAFDTGGRCDRTIAVYGRWAGVSGHCELQEQQRAQAKPGDIFLAHSTHKVMITRSLVQITTR